MAQYLKSPSDTESGKSGVLTSWTSSNKAAVVLKYLISWE